jgi:hypothetical protein
MTKNNKKFSTPRTTPPDAFSTRLARLCEGLVYISETDSPVVPFFGEKAAGVTASSVLKATGHSPASRVQELSADDFFDRLTGHAEWFGPAEAERADSFARLEAFLKENLSGLKVFRIGTVSVDIYAVGQRAGGRLAGVATKAVET